MPESKLTAPKEDPIQVAETYDRAITIPGVYTQYRDDVVAAAQQIKAITFPDAEGLQAGVNALSSVVDIIKTVESVEEQHRKPVNKWLKDIRKTRDEFLAAVTMEKDRLTGLVNHYRKKEIEEQQKREREAQRAKEEAEARAKKALEDAAKATTEEAKMDAELAAEEANMQAGEAELAMSVPVHTPKGLATRVRFDFEIVNARTAINTAELGGFFEWKKDEEVFKFRRAECIKALNADESDIKNLLPAEDQQDVTHAGLGVRIFRDVSIHIR